LYNYSVRKILLVIAAVSSALCSCFAVFMMIHSGPGLRDVVLTVLAYVFPALSFPLFLIYLRLPLAGKIGSWAILAGAFLSFLFVYRYSCHQQLICVDASMIVFARCTIQLAWHLRFMLATALLLQMAPVDNSVTRALRRLEG
jgi:hypothetical protein